MHSKHIRIVSLFIILAAVTGLHHCKSSQKVSGPDAGGPVTIYQDGQETTVSQEDIAVIKIKKEKFAIRFSNKKYNSELNQFYAGQLTAFSSISGLMVVNTGMKIEETPCFSPGTGMAASATGYESLMLNNIAHHYLMYENENDKRVNLISESNGMLRLEFPIDKLYLNDMDVKIENTELSELCLALLIDKNLNGKIEKGELTKMILKFE